MRFTNITSALALTVALGFSGAASAATIVGGVVVNDIDLPRVQEMCDRMVGDFPESVELDGDDATTMGGEGAMVADTDEETGESIDDITVRDCVQAGLLPADTPIENYEIEGATTD